MRIILFTFGNNDDDYDDDDNNNNDNSINLLNCLTTAKSHL
jgi:hypothetical protein